MPTNNTNTPQFQFFPVDGLPFNRLIQLAPECCVLIVNLINRTKDIALWIHWQQFSQGALDMDTVLSMQQPGIWCGTTPIWKLNAALAADGSFYAVKYRQPIIKLKQPVGFFYVTGWSETPPATGVALSGQVQIIATNDVEDAYLPLMGGQ